MMETFTIYMAVLLSENLEIKYNEKIVKYVSLVQKIKKVWQQEKVTIVPVIICVIGQFPTNLKKLKYRDIEAYTKTSNVVKRRKLSGC